jgi:hypothetical protein
MDEAQRWAQMTFTARYSETLGLIPYLGSSLLTRRHSPFRLLTFLLKEAGTTTHLPLFVYSPTSTAVLLYRCTAVLPYLVLHI